jgi:hypothetical protein
LLLTVREVQGLKVLENKILSRIISTKKDDIIGSWGRLHNEELHNA